MNKRFKIIIGVIIGILVSALGICFILVTAEDRTVGKAIEFLEDEDYECELFEEYKGYVDDYVCTLVEDGKKHEFIIGKSNKFFDKLLLDTFYSRYYFSDEDYNFELYETSFTSNLNYIQLVGPGFCAYVPDGYYADMEIDFGKKREAIVSKDSDDTGICELYLNDFNYALDMYRELFEELEKEL